MKLEDFDKMVPELQVGNLLNIKEVGVGKIYSINYVELGLHFNSPPCSDNFNHEELEPIPITKDIFIQLGFRFKEEDGKAYFICSPKALFLRVIDKKIYFGDNLEIKYVHQLQNIYYWYSSEKLDVSSILEI